MPAQKNYLESNKKKSVTDVAKLPMYSAVSKLKCSMTIVTSVLQKKKKKIFRVVEISYFITENV